MIKTKRFLLVFVSLLLFFILASCGDDTINTDNTQNTNDNTSNGDNGQSTDEDKYYTITFKNDNGDILSSSRFKEGTMPSYNGNTPLKPSDQNYQYVFEKWDKEITLVICDTEYIAVFKAIPYSYCLVQFDSKGGSDVSSQNILKGEKATKPSNPRMKGYTFDDWYYQGERWSFIGYTVTENMTLEAKWNINSYNLSLSRNNNKAGTISNNSGSHNYNESITIKAETNPGYTFNGWYDGDNQVSPLETYTFNMPANNLSYTAKWTANTNTTYKVEHYLQNIDNTNYPELPYETDNLTGTTDTLTNGEVNTYEGFTSPTITQVNINGDGSTVIKLNYARNGYTVSLSQNNEKAGTITGSGTYKYGKEITIKAETNPGYTFNGWYFNGSLYEEDASFTYTIGSSKVSFEARYTVNKYTITLDNQATGVTISGITSGNEYEYDTEITLTATNIPYGCTVKWVRSDDVVYSGENYTFKVPAGNITITTKLKLYIREEKDIYFDTIYFGTYPQTKVEASVENGLLDYNTFDSTWISYKYYISSEQQDFMYYKDVDIDNNGTYDYRGVYFTQYRPYYYSYPSSTSYTYQDENGYSTNTIYWFSYDPIEWNVLTESDGKALILANLILDSQDYYPSLSTSIFSHNGGTGYANNYELSAIRKFLNDNFYNTAFNALQKALIEETTVDNSASSTLIEETTVDNSASSTGNSSSSCACNNTKDKLFLLSYSEVEIESDTYRLISTHASESKGTDYAKSQGLFVMSSNANSEWWLRSPAIIQPDCVYYINDYGTISGDYVCTGCFGVRPVCWINL